MLSSSSSSSSSRSSSSSSVVATMSREVQEALRDSLITYLPALLPAASGATYWFQPEEFKILQCPAIFIYDGGWTKVFETMRGTGPEGTTMPGMAQRRYDLDVDVYLRGRKADELRHELQRWADAITAVVQNDWQLGEGAIDAQATVGEPTVPFKEGSSVLMATRIQVQADVYVFQGSVTLESSSSSSSSSSESA